MSADEAAEEHVGETVAGKYQLLRLLGAGGMGAVYEAEHVFTKRHVALKRMHPGIARSRIAAERFVRESQAPSSIGHPGIVQVLDGGFDADGSLYLVLELLDGVSMNDALEEHALEAPAIVQIGIELLEALAAAHDKGFIHRDIKPDNIFLAHDGRDGVVVKLLDFGIASVRDSEGDVKLTQTGAILGTPLYMSPEQAKGQRIDARSDLWSVGAMLYRALAGEAPFQGESYNALIVSIVTQEHVPLGSLRRDLPKGLLSVVERALQKDVSRRFQSAKEMAEALRAVSFVDDEHDAAGTAPSLPPYASLRPAANKPAKDAADPTRKGRRVAHRTSGSDATADTMLSTGDVLANAHDASKPDGKTDETAALPPSLVASMARQGAAARPAMRGQTTQPVERESGIAWGTVATYGAGVLLLLLAAFLVLRPRALPVTEPEGATAGMSAATAKHEPSARAKQPEPEEPSAKPSDEGERGDEATSDEAKTQEQAEETPAAKSPEAKAEGLSVEAITSVLSEQEPAMQRCLEEAVVAQMLAGSARAEAVRLDVELQIAASGRTERVDVQGKAAAELGRCVRGALQNVAFPSAAAPTVFRYPLVFQPTIVGK